MVTMLGRIGAFLLDIFQVVIFAGAIFLVLYLLVMQPHKIKGSSMENNFHDGEYLLTDKISYRFREPNRGEVIIFKAPGANGDDFIKRIIGLPGEKVSIHEGKVYINGLVLNEIYIPQTTPTNAGVFLSEDKELEVPAGEYFVLGDNRNHSADSRTFGFIQKSSIIGKAWFLYWPLSNLGLIPAPKYQ